MAKKPGHRILLNFGAVYTQTTDVELEINGYLTYDRKVLKFDVAQVAAAHREVLGMARLGALNRHATAVVPVFPKHDPDAKAWAYTMTEPSGEWTKPGFDDAVWARSAGGFGDKSIAVHTEAKVVQTAGGQYFDTGLSVEVLK